MNGFSGYRGNWGINDNEFYLKEISGIKLLSLEEEAELSQRIMGKKDRRAMNKLVYHNLRFVVSVARNYQNQGLPMSDLISEGNTGLINAAQKFDYRKNFKFVSFAVWDIRQRILKALAEQSRACRIPLNRSVDVGRYSRMRDCLEQRYKRFPSVEDTANEIHMKIKDAVLADRLLEGSVSLSKPNDSGNHNKDKGDGVCLEDSLYDKDAPPTDFKAEQSDRSRYVNEVIDSLGDERQSKAIKMSFGVNKDHTPYTLDEMGKMFGVSREMARQIKEKALRRLRSPTFSNKLRPAL